MNSLNNRNQTEDETRYEGYQQIQKNFLEYSKTRMGYLNSMTSSLYVTEQNGKFDFSFEGESQDKLINNTSLGLDQDSYIQNMIQVGDPWQNSDVLISIHKYEIEIIEIMAKHLGMGSDEIRGYVTGGGTESNLACLWWSKKYLAKKDEERIMKTEMDMETADGELERLRKYKLLNEMRKPIVYFSKEHTHYSVKKCCEILSLDVVEVASKETGHIDLEAFEKVISNHISNHPHRSIIVNANLGTTIYGAIDDAQVINEILMQLTDNQETTKYTIHGDAAWMGSVLPVLKPFGDVNNYFTDIGVNTMAICGGKYIGATLSGIALAKKDLVDLAYAELESIVYLSKARDNTVTGCRSAWAILLVHNALHSWGLHKDRKFFASVVGHNLENVKYFYDRLCKITTDIIWNGGMAIVFKSPSYELMQKYTLMAAPGGKVAICVNHKISRQLIDTFLEELINDIEKNKTNSS
jgi:histidine decarboxylase